MENEETTEDQGKKKGGKKKIFLLFLLTAGLAAGGVFGFQHLWQAANYLVTDNARVTTNLIVIAPSMPGVLERFTAAEGNYVRENEILGWVKNGEAMRSPIDGLVIYTNAVQDQVVTPQEPVAVIADINSIHIRANIEETEIAKIQPGQNVFVTIDTFGARQFAGYISEIGRITQAELTGNAMSFTTGGTFNRITHLIPVKINLIDDINLHSLIGINARVRIQLRQQTRNARTASGGTAAGALAGVNAQGSAPAANDIAARGVVESVQRRSVYTTLGYIVERVLVEPGDRVTEGQILCVLDTKDLRNQLLNAEASLRIAEINLAMAEHNLQIRRSLYSTQAIARDELQQLEFMLESAKAARQQAQAILDGAVVILERSVIRAPINGTVTDVIAREGAVGTGRLFVIEDTDHLRIMIRLRQYDMGRIRPGMNVVITSDATGITEYAGVISRINPAAIQSTGTGSSSVVEFEAEVLVVSQNTGLLIGMNTRLSIILE